MDAQYDKKLASVHVGEQVSPLNHPERLILAYWLISVVLGFAFLWDWLSAWNVGATLARPWLVLYLMASFVFSQTMYVLVARHSGRPIAWGPLVLFALGNGIAETFAFAVVYRIGELLGSGLVGLFVPQFASFAGFLLGIFFFTIYGGLIHALFWMRLLPPHLDESTRARTIRKFRPLGETALVIGWSLCLWLTRDIWTVVFFHILVDVGLMLLVRPPIFRAGSHRNR